MYSKANLKWNKPAEFTEELLYLSEAAWQPRLKEKKKKISYWIPYNKERLVGLLFSLSWWINSLFSRKKYQPGSGEFLHIGVFGISEVYSTASSSNLNDWSWTNPIKMEYFKSLGFVYIYMCIALQYASLVLTPQFSFACLYCMIKYYCLPLAQKEVLNSTIGQGKYRPQLSKSRSAFPFHLRLIILW